jgi:hypothetical protein
MTEVESSKYQKQLKVAWVIYTILVIIVAAVMVFVIAQDNEEMLFYGLMTIAVSYVFRPTEAFFKKHITRIMGSAEE